MGATYYMGESTFVNETKRRERLAMFRTSAARSGYRGRVAFQHYGIHGRPRGFIKVTIHERSSS